MVHSLSFNKSTIVRFSIPPTFLTVPLRVAPWLRRPVLTQLFLTPHKRAPGAGEAHGHIVGTLRVGQGTVRVRVRGRGPTVLLVHGWQGSASHLKSIGDRLVLAGFAVATCDMPAHGETEGRLTSLPEFVATIAGAASLLGPLHGIVAHSLGATATALALYRGLSVRTALLVAPMPSFDFALDEFAKVLHLSDELREETARGTEERVGITRSQADLLALGRPACRVTIAHDVDDARVPFHYSTKLAREWGLSEPFSTHGLGHRRILEDHGFLQWVEENLRAVEAPSIPPLAFPCAPELNW